MSRRTTPRNRTRRRRSTTGPELTLDRTQLQLPTVLRYLTNPKMFFVVGVLMVGAMLGSLFVGSLFGGATVSDAPIMQANELPDAPVDHSPLPDQPLDTTAPPRVPTVVAKTYSAPPPMVIDASKRYVATIKTAKGDIQMELYPQQAPEAVNAFIFLARDGYYNGTPFMELVKNADGSRFYAQAGDPTRTSLGTPGFSIKKEPTTRPFARGALGMGGSAENSNGGQFFISYVDNPALTGKYTIFGQVVSGLDVLERLSLLDVTSRTPTGSGDTIQSVEISEP